MSDIELTLDGADDKKDNKLESITKENPDLVENNINKMI